MCLLPSRGLARTLSLAVGSDGWSHPLLQIHMQTEVKNGKDKVDFRQKQNIPPLYQVWGVKDETGWNWFWFKAAKESQGESTYREMYFHVNFYAPIPCNWTSGKMLINIRVWKTQ